MPEKPKTPKRSVKRLSSDDKILWDAVVRDVVPLNPKVDSQLDSEACVAVDVSPVLLPQLKPVQKLGVPAVRARQAADRGTDRGGASLQSLPHSSGRQVDAALKKRFEAGELPFDATLDLHGLTEDAAHQRFVIFLRQAIARGARMLLVITGKGRGGEGVLRRNLPVWCESPEFHNAVLRLSPARPQHGGGGAFYFLLRKKRG